MQDRVDAVLRTHDPQVDQHPGARLTRHGVQHRTHAQRVGAAAHDRRVLAGDLPPGQGDPAVRLVGGDDLLGGAVGQLLEQQQAPELEAPAERRGPPEAGEVQLGVEVVLVEHEPDTARPPEQAQRPVGVRGVAGLDRLGRTDPADGEGEDERPHPAVGELVDVGRQRPRFGSGRVPQDADALQGLPGEVARTLRADDGHGIPCVSQRKALQPHPAVQGDRKVLDDDQDMSWRSHGLTSPCRHCGKGGTVSGWFAGKLAPLSTASPTLAPCGL